MGDLIEFPSKSVRDWAVLERGIRRALVNAGASTEMQSHVVSRMHSFWKEELEQSYVFKFNMRPSLNISKQSSMEIENSIREAVSNFQEQIQEHHQKLFIDRTKVEIDLFKATYGM